MRLRVAVLVGLLWALASGPAQALFHLVMVVEVFPGYASNPNAQYVELQMYFPGQNLVAGHAVQVFNAAGTPVGTFTFPSNVPNGADQASILVATAEAQTLFGVTADLTMTPAILAAGGKVCFTGSGDCAAWGNYSGSPIGVGNPFSPGGLPLGQAMQRNLDRGTPGFLDLADDTDDSATDFLAAAPTPRNNAGTIGAVAGYSSTPAPPGPINFGSVVVGFPVGASFQVRESGGAALSVSNPSLGGANPGDFAVTTSFPLNIPDGGSPVTVQLTCTPQALGGRSATLTLTTNDPARPTVAYDLACTGDPVPAALMFFTVTPCRVVDTRSVGGPLGCGVARTIAVGGASCLVPGTAKAVSLNVAVTLATAAGNVRLYPEGAPVPLGSTINYAAGQTRTNNAVVGLSSAGELAAQCFPSGSTHLILDVNGYFE